MSEVTKITTVDITRAANAAGQIYVATFVALYAFLVLLIFYLFFLIRITPHTATAVFSPDGRTILIALGNTDASLWDVASARPIRTFYAGGIVNSATFTPAGASVLTASNDGSAQLWRVSDGRLLRTYAANPGDLDFVLHAAISPDERYILTVDQDQTQSSNSGTHFWNLAAAQVLGTIQSGTTPNTAAFSPDGMFIVSTAGMASEANVWYVQTGKLFAGLKAGAGGPEDAIFSPDGALIITVCRDRTARIFDAARGTLERTYQLASGPASVALNPSGTEMLVGLLNGNTELLDMATGAVRHMFKWHHDEVTSVVFSPDGRSLLTASSEGTARLWDASSYKPLISFRRPRAWVEKYLTWLLPGTLAIFACSMFLSFYARRLTGPAYAAYFADALMLIAVSAVTISQISPSSDSAFLPLGLILVIAVQAFAVIVAARVLFAKYLALHTTVLGLANVMARYARAHRSPVPTLHWPGHPVRTLIYAVLLAPSYFLFLALDKAVPVVPFVPLVIPIAMLVLLQRAYMMSADKILALDTRAPVLFLRSFAAERTRLWGKGVVGKLRGKTIDEAIAPAAKMVGPFVAIADPNSRLPRLGAAKTYYSDDTWQSAISRWVDMAQMIVMVAGRTEGIHWEVGHIFKKNAHTKLIVMLPAAMRRKPEEAVAWFRENFGRSPYSGALEGLDYHRAIALVFRTDDLAVIETRRPRRAAIDYWMAFRTAIYIAVVAPGVASAGDEAR